MASFAPPMDPSSTYSAFLPHLEKLYRKFRRRYRCDFSGDVQEMMSLANFLFWKAYRRWDPEKGGLKQRVSFVVWNGWKDQMRTKINRDKKLRRVELSEDLRVERRRFDREEMEERVQSPDGKAVLRAALRYPHVEGGEKRCLLVSFLVELGWCGQRICEAFTEVKEALGGTLTGFLGVLLSSQF